MMTPLLIGETVTTQVQGKDDAGAPEVGHVVWIEDGEAVIQFAWGTRFFRLYKSQRWGSRCKGMNGTCWILNRRN
jgi:hypothetical protein